MTDSLCVLQVRANPKAFLVFWLVQALWIFLTALPVYLLNCKQRQLKAPENLLDQQQTDDAHGESCSDPLDSKFEKHYNQQIASVGLRDKVGWSMWAAGFVLQVVADRQKNAFRARSDTHGKFINEGLW